MNKLQSFRCLLLEQLESRCMLAGGVFSHSLDQRGLDQRGDDQHDRPQQQEVADRRLDSGRLHSFDRGRGGSRHVFNSRPRSASFGNVTDTPQQNLLSTPSPTQFNQPPSLPIVVVDILGPSNSTQQRSFATEPSRGSNANDSDPSSPRVSTSTLASIANSLAEDVRTQANSRATATGESASINNPFQADAVPTNGQEIVSPDVGNIANYTASLNSSYGSDRGVIESLSLLRRELHTPAEQDAGESWQLDSQSIDRLREVSREPSNAVEADPNHRADTMIASWFNGQTGLMDIEATGKLQTPVNSLDSIVDVVLTATIGLHRCVDLIASATPKPDTIPDDVRGAILASISAEQRSPLPDPATLGVSAITYPAAAIVATGVTIAARRKRSGVKMESSR